MLDFSKTKNILIVRLGKIGDMILASSAIEIIKNNYPEIKISLLTLNKNKELLKYNPKISYKYFTNKNVLLYFKLFFLRLNKYELLIDLNDDHSKTSKFIRKILNPKKSVAFHFNIYNNNDISIERPSKETTHIIERIGFLLNNIGIDFSKNDLMPKIYLGKKELTDIRNQFVEIKKDNKILAINLSAGAPIRYWSNKKWIELIQLINKNYSNWRVLLLTDKKDKHLKEEITNELEQELLIPQMFNSFQHFASYLSQADLIISPDTSAVHIASAFNIPIIALYPNYQWNFVSWQPLSEKFISIKSEEENIDAIKVEEVFSAFNKITE